MDDIELVDHILTLLRSLHETGWDYNVEAVLTSIAEVEGADKGYSDDQVTELAEKLIGVQVIRRPQFRGRLLFRQFSSVNSLPGIKIMTTIATAKTFGRTKNENTAQNIAAEKSASYGLSVFDGWFYIGAPDELKKLGCDVRPFQVKPKHSPGPWEISGDIVVSAPIPCRNPKAGERRDTVCKIGWNFDGDSNRTGDLLWREAAPNMALIAAAPSLMEAVQECLSELTSAEYDDGNHPVCMRVIEILRAAISQAVQVTP